MMWYKGSKNLLIIVLLVLAGSSTLSCKVLSNKEWFKSENLSKPVMVQIDGRAMDVDKDTAKIIAFYYQKPPDYYFLPEKKNFLNKEKECAHNIKNDIYSFGADKKMIELPSDFSWREDPLKDANWQFRFHGWKFMDCLIDGYWISKDQWYLDRLKWVVSDWWRDNFKQNYPSKFSWYDHSIPKRLHRMLQIFELLRRNRALDEVSTATILRAIFWHAEILSDAKELYIKNHNHGLDQSNILFETSQILPEFILASKWKKVAIRRLQNEIDYALTPEGIHKENSPGYHLWVSSYCAQINDFSQHYAGKLLLDNSTALEEGALKFAVAISRPDRALAQLGDTAPYYIPYSLAYPNLEKLSWYPYYQYLVSQGKKGKKPKETSFLFPKSGYFIYRDKWDEPGENTAVHLVLKCEYLSRGHRHNDDGNILLYAFGEDWLIDAGQYGYGKSIYRSYVLRPSAHNLSFPVSAKNSWPNDSKHIHSLKERFEKYGNDWGILDISNSYVQCRTHLYKGFTYQRELLIIGKRSFSLRESIVPEESNDSQYFATLFKVPDDKEVYINKNKRAILIVNKSYNHSLKIQYHKPFTKIELYRGEESDELLSFETIGWKKTRPAKTIALFDKNTSFVADFDLGLMPAPDLRGYQKMTIQKSKKAE